MHGETHQSERIGWSRAPFRGNKNTSMSRIRFWVTGPAVLACLLSLTAAAAAEEGAEPALDSRASSGTAVQPGAQEDKALEKLNERINRPDPNAPTPADQRARALELPGDDEADIDRFEQYE